MSQRQEEYPTYEKDGISISNTDVANLYADWDTPTTIVSDGAYGTGLFPNEPNEPREINDWYESHIKSWSKRATRETTLWFWNTELGWAEVHPVLEKHNWEYQAANIWNKGMGHIAGNSNTQKLRKFPQVTEVCVEYVYKPKFTSSKGDKLSMQEWVINEWERSGLTRQEANEACGVADAASRKYLTKGNVWYYPPPERMEALVEYANEHGEPDGKPYFARDGESLTAEEWKTYRAKFDCPAGVTNVWEHPQVNGDERVQDDDENGSFHINQKPLELMKRIIKASTEEEDIIWEPFGGLCTASVAAKKLNREARGSEIVEEFYDAAVERVKEAERNEPAEQYFQSGLDDWE